MRGSEPTWADLDDDLRSCVDDCIEGWPGGARAERLAARFADRAAAPVGEGGPGDWKSEDHDDYCESEFVHGPMAYSPCDCSNRRELRRRGFTVERRPPAAVGGGGPDDEAIVVIEASGKPTWWGGSPPPGRYRLTPAADEEGGVEAEPPSGEWPVPIPADSKVRAALAEFAGLTDDERHALDQWCYDQAQKRARGVLLHDGEPPEMPILTVRCGWVNPETGLICDAPEDRPWHYPEHRNYHLFTVGPFVPPTARPETEVERDG